VEDHREEEDPSGDEEQFRDQDLDHPPPALANAFGIVKDRLA